MTPDERARIEKAVKMADDCAGDSAFYGASPMLALSVLADAARAYLALTAPEFADRLATKIFTEGGPHPRTAEAIPG